MATSTYKTFLMHGTGSGSTFEKLVDIKEFPDLGGEPELLETTTLSDKMQTYILGLQSSNGMSFTCNYDSDDYDKLKALEGEEQSLSVWFGGTESSGTVTPTGSEGKFNFKGLLTVYVNGAGTNAVRDMTVYIAPSTTIDKVSE